jgi:putative SOS response-associated peptidase YedK
MCGRSVIPKRQSVIEAFRVRYFSGDVNVLTDMRPGQSILGLFGMDADVRSDFDVVGQAFRWGAGPDHIYNARLETVSTKPMWKRAWTDKSRLIIPVSRFQEGRAWFAHKDDKPLAIAALDGGWSGDDQLEAVMLTTAAIGPVAPVHHRMPVLLTEDLWPHWLALKPITQAELLASTVVMATDELRLAA